MTFSRLSLLAALTCLALLAASTAAQRAPPMAFAPSSSPSVRGLPALAERLEGAEAQQCWEALVEIKSCTGEIIILFIKGEAFLGPGCCSAIRVIEQSCWAADSVLSIIGFTPQEGDMLKGYCNAGGDNDGGGQSGSPPPRGADAVGAAARESVAAVAGRKSSMHR
ncbi:egg cell-secreted protein 1.3-like [Miscanthus floridulus]|uniref:egg cell-secreted protein 1.3-like n=1 Tax=Miscanthus floridulus TaxID=154761 RepID=UPI0034590781